MDIQDLQLFLESPRLKTGFVTVDLVKIARNVTAYQQKNDIKFKLILDAECCLQNLYGGQFSDWTCGGQWNRTVQFLSSLLRVMRQRNIDVVFAFNGAAEPQRLSEWITDQANIRDKVAKVLNHLNTKGTPPPRSMWTEPTSLKTVLRLTLHQLRANVMFTIDDHQQEVMSYCRKYRLHGLLGDDPVYAVFDPPRYFSSKQLELTYDGLIVTKEFTKLTQSLLLNNEQICVLGSLLTTSYFQERELEDVYKEVVVMTGCKKDKKLTGEAGIKVLANYVRSIPPPSKMDELVAKLFRSPYDSRADCFRRSVQYYLKGTANEFVKRSSTSDEQPSWLDTVGLNRQKVSSSSSGDTKVNLPATSSSSTANRLSAPPKHIPSLVTNLGLVLVGTISPAVIRMASHYHQKGLMSPTILQLLSTREIRLPCVMEDEHHRELPRIHDVFKLLRQRLYAVVFDLHDIRGIYFRKIESGELLRNTPQPNIVIKEWIYHCYNPYRKPELVMAEPLPWEVPTLHRLWFGMSVEDYRLRMKVFLSCLSSDTSLILNRSFGNKLVVILVLRFIIAQSKPILRRQELDAFLCQAYSPHLVNVQYLDDLTVNVTSRGVQLAAMFMQGVEIVILVNEACRSPVPSAMCIPNNYFNGKLFQNMLSRLIDTQNIFETCENNYNILRKVRRARYAILNGLPINFAHAPLSPFRG